MISSSLAFDWYITWLYLEIQIFRHQDLGPKSHSLRALSRVLFSFFLQLMFFWLFSTLWWIWNRCRRCQDKKVKLLPPYIAKIFMLPGSFWFSATLGSRRNCWNIQTWTNKKNSYFCSSTEMIITILFFVGRYGYGTIYQIVPNP